MALYKIGYTGEKNAREIKIPIAEYQALWPDAVVTATYTRPDGQTYNVSGTVEDEYYVWIPTLTDCQVKGFGTIYLSFTDTDKDLLGKTPEMDVEVDSSGAEPGEAPEGWQNWVDTLTELGATTQANAQSASESANTATTCAENAAISEENALGSATQAATSAETASEKATEANESANTATTKASEAASSAQEAKDKAAEIEVDLSKKQDVITDLDTIRAGAAKGMTALQEHQDISGKVDKIAGKGLSTNDYTDADKAKLDGIDEGANKTTIDDALSDSSTNPVQNKVITSQLSQVKNDITSQKADISQLETALKSGSKDDAVWHLGFYLDDDGYLCQKGDDD